MADEPAEITSASEAALERGLAWLAKNQGLKDKALADAVWDEPDWAGQKYTADAGKTLKARQYDRVALGARGLQYERLDQLTIEILMGAR